MCVCTCVPYVSVCGHQACLCVQYMCVAYYAQGLPQNITRKNIVQNFYDIQKLLLYRVKNSEHITHTRTCTHAHMHTHTHTHPPTHPPTHTHTHTHTHTLPHTTCAPSCPHPCRRSARSRPASPPAPGCPGWCCRGWSWDCDRTYSHDTGGCTVG